METDDRVSKLAAKVRRLRILCICLGIGLVWTSFRLADLKRQASYDLSTHYNLYYSDWKEGKRAYEPVVALKGMYHDLEFRDSLKGMTVAEFERKFPNTFFEIQGGEPDAHRRSFIDSYEDAKKGNASYGWIAVFENDRLIELEFTKG